MPSPGFGIRRMSSDMAAPIPVRIIPAASTAIRAASPAGAGIHAENRFMNRVNARLSGSCKASSPSTTASGLSPLRMQCSAISTATNTAYSANVISPKLSPESSAAQ